MPLARAWLTKSHQALDRASIFKLPFFPTPSRRLASRWCLSRLGDVPNISVSSAHPRTDFAQWRFSHSTTRGMPKQVDPDWGLTISTIPLSVLESGQAITSAGSGNDSWTRSYCWKAESHWIQKSWGLPRPHHGVKDPNSYELITQRAL
jgi:hypothetical protein